MLYNLGLIILSLFLSSCGFTPLYNQKSDGYLGQVKVGTIEERSGQILRNILLESFSPFGEERPLYEINAQVNYSTRNLSVQKDATTTRAQAVVQFDFSLTHIGSGKVLFKGTESSVADYNILTSSPYSTLISKKDAHVRLLDGIALGIRRQVATFFKGYKPKNHENKQG